MRKCLRDLGLTLFNVKTVIKDNSDIVGKLLQELGNVKVMVGIPDQNQPQQKGSNERKDGKVTNAQLAFLQSNGVRSVQMRAEMDSSGLPYSKAHQAYLRAHGSPAMAVPPRPFLEPAIEQDKTKAAIAGHMGAAIKATLNDDQETASKEYELAGMTGMSAAKDYIHNGSNLLPNAPSTVKAKAKKHAGKAPPPLEDTGAMVRAITYVVREGK